MISSSTRRTTLFATPFLLSMLAAGQAPKLVARDSGDWPEFRGPSAQGHAVGTDFPLSWNGEQSVVWKTDLPGEGWSSPVVMGDKVVVTAAVGTGNESGYQLRVYCLDRATGGIAWEKTVFSEAADAPRIHLKNSRASPTAVIEGDRVYAHFGHLGTACLSLEGAILWTNRELGYEPVHGNGGSPVIVGDKLIFSADAGKDPFLAALDKDSGKVQWKVPRRTDAAKKFSFSTPLVIPIDGAPQVISPGSNSVGGFDPATGREIWRVRYEGYSVVPRPVYAHGLIFISTGYQRATLLAIDPTGRGDVTDTHVRWKLEKRVSLTPSFLCVGDELYLVSDGGVVSCLEARTGRLVWTGHLRGNFSASPLYAAGRIYVTSEEGITTVLKPGREFVRLSENEIDERTLASLAAAGDSLFLRTAKGLYCLRREGTGDGAGESR